LSRKSISTTNVDYKSSIEAVEYMNMYNAVSLGAGVGFIVD